MVRGIFIFISKVKWLTVQDWLLKLPGLGALPSLSLVMQTLNPLGVELTTSNTPHLPPLLPVTICRGTQ